MYHISLYFDIKTETHMREYIRKVAEDTENTYMLDADVLPHITLAAFECEKESELKQRLETLVCRMQPGMLQWVSVGVEVKGHPSWSTPIIAFISRIRLLFVLQPQLRLSPASSA